jgi:integrase
LKAQLIPYFGALELHEITPFHVSQFIAKRLKEGVRKSTINRELTVLKKMLNLAIDWGFEIAKNPVVKGNYFSEEEYKRDRILTAEEEGRLFEAASGHLRPILLCALVTGMRLSEVLGLTWDNVDLERRQITVRAESSKSGRSRVIPLNQSLYRCLAGLKASNGHGNNVFLYVDPSTGKGRPVRTVRRAFKESCRRAGIKNLRFHDLRHTFGSRLIEKGADPVSVKNLLGHANLKTTEIYLHSSLDQMKKAVDLLDGPPALGVRSEPNLLHMCDTGRRPKTKKPANDLLSVN